MNDELDEQETIEEIGSWKFQPIVIVLRLIQFMGNIHNAFRLFHAGLSEDICAHINYKIEQQTFAAEAGRELEKMVKGEDG